MVVGGRFVQRVAAAVVAVLVATLLTGAAYGAGVLSVNARTAARPRNLQRNST